jgi:hypothetical protein
MSIKKLKNFKGGNAMYLEESMKIEAYKDIKMLWNIIYDLNKSALKDVVIKDLHGNKNTLNNVISNQLNEQILKYSY